MSKLKKNKFTLEFMKKLGTEININIVIREMIEVDILTITGYKDGEPIINLRPEIRKELNDIKAGKIPEHSIFKERTKKMNKIMYK